MSNKNNTDLKKNYFIACASALLAALSSVLFYPENHGISATSRGSLIIVSLAMLGLFVWIFTRANKEETPADGNESEIADREARMRKMSLIWFALAALLGGSLLRYPISDYMTQPDGPLHIKTIASFVTGAGIAVFSVIRIYVVLQKKDAQ